VEDGGTEAWAAEVRILQENPALAADAAIVFRRLAGYTQDPLS
jgi:hypothetical protein